MGASDFYDVGLGKTPDEAFNKLRDDAAWEHGHGGYTGTIAEKGWFRLFTLPSGVSAREAVDAALDYRGNGDGKDKLIKLGFMAIDAKQIFEMADDKWGYAVAFELTGAELASARERYDKTRGSSVHLYESGPKKGQEIPDTRKKLGPEPETLRGFVFFGYASS